MTHRADRATAQQQPSRSIDIATRRVLARVAVSDSVARCIAELAYQAQPETWRGARV